MTSYDVIALITIWKLSKLVMNHVVEKYLHKSFNSKKVTGGGSLNTLQSHPPPPSQTEGHQKSPIWIGLIGVLKNRSPAGEHCCRAVKFESGKTRRENWWPHLLKVCFCSCDYFHSKTKMEPPKKRFPHLTNRRWKWTTPCRKRISKTLNMPQGPLYVCISTLILVKNLFCFNNCTCGLFCVCYITKL